MRRRQDEMRQDHRNLMDDRSSPPRRVLHVSASSMLGGGPEHVWRLVQYLPKHIESYIAAPQSEPYGARFNAVVGEDRIFVLPQRKFTFRALLGLVGFVRRKNIDIIHSHGKGAGVYGRIVAFLTGVRSVHTFHGIHLPSNKVFRWAYLMLERILSRISKLSIAVSESEATEARSLGITSGRLVVIPNGVEVTQLLQQGVRAKPFTLVHVSRFDPVQKNSAWLLDLALALRKVGRLSECRFVLIGDGEGRAALERKISEGDMESFFYFAGSQASIRPFLREASCFISTSRWEGLPLAVLEAQAEGVPAIVTDVVGNRDAVLDGKTGFLYPLDDAVTAVSYVEMLLDDAQMWQQMSIAAHKRICEAFSVRQMAEKTAELY